MKAESSSDMCVYGNSAGQPERARCIYRSVSIRLDSIPPPFLLAAAYASTGRLNKNLCPFNALSAVTLLISVFAAPYYEPVDVAQLRAQ
jgi:hypothetical protein